MFIIREIRIGYSVEIVLVGRMLIANRKTLIIGLLLVASSVLIYINRLSVLLYQLPNITLLKKECSQYNDVMNTENMANWSRSKSLAAYLLEFGINIQNSEVLRRPFSENTGYTHAHLKAVLGYPINENGLLSLYSVEGASVALEMIFCKNPNTVSFDSEILNLLGHTNNKSAQSIAAWLANFEGRKFDDPKIFEMETKYGLPVWLMYSIGGDGPYRVPPQKYLAPEYLSKRIGQGKHGWNTPAHFFATNPQRMTTEIAQALLKNEVLAIKDSKGQTVKERLIEKGYLNE